MVLALILDGSSLTISLNTFCTKIEKFSMAVLQPLVTTLVGLSILCILTLPYIFPDVESSTVTNFFANAFTVVPFFYPDVNSFLHKFC